jgi:cytochrome P450
MRAVWNTVLLVCIAIFVTHWTGGFPDPLGGYEVYLWYALAALVSLLVTRAAWFRFRYDMYKIPLTKKTYTEKDFPNLTKQELRHENEKTAPRINPPLTRLMILGQIPVVVVHDYSLYYDIAVAGINSYKPGYLYSRVTTTATSFNAIFGGLTTASAYGEEWKWRKAALVNHFQARNVVPNLLPYIVEKGNEILQHFEATLGEHVEVDEIFVNATLDIIFRYITGEKRPDVDREIQDKSVRGSTFRVMWSAIPYLAIPIILFGRGVRMFMPPKSRKAADDVYSYCGRVIDYVTEKHKHADENQYVPPIVKAAKTKDYNWATKKGKNNLTADFNILLFAGHDTTAHSLSFLLYELARNPAVQTRVFKEIRQSFGPPSTAKISAETVANLPVFSAAIRESMRCHVIIPAVASETAVDVTFGGYRVPAGTYLFINLLGMSHDPRYFEDPDRFNIDRWLSESNNEFYEDKKADIAQKKHNIDVAFNFGAHACLGRNLALLELRVLTAMIINSYEVSVAKYFNVKFEHGAVLRPANGMYLSFKKRHEHS